MIATTSIAAHSGVVLTDEMLARFHQRAPVYDRENRFFSEDFEELRESGYLNIAVPRELGGQGLALAEVSRLQRRLAYYAPATAIAVNMHLYWTGIAADLWHMGDSSLEWLLRASADGEVFAAGHAERGNDIPVLLSTTRAERVPGGYRFSGQKSFGSLTPVWTFLGLHGMDSSDPAAPKIVHAFMPRDTPGATIKETWDTLGMRATRSDDTLLEGAFVPDQYIPRVLPAGRAGVDRFILCMYAWSLLGFASVYQSIAQRALDLTVESVKEKRIIALSRPLAYHAEVQHEIAEMVFDLEAITVHLERTVQDWADGVQYPAWPLKIIATKYHVVEGAWRVVDRALDLSGGAGIFKRNEIERLFRDARLGRVHPANSALAHELTAKMTLGIDPDETPRWG
jgi:alkylation response protein AidB-like acyl-CoA dehydrogenase